ANIPVSVARSAGAARVIVSDVTDLPDESLNFDSPIEMADRLLDWLFKQPPDTLNSADLLVRSPIDGYSTLDFSDAAIDSLIVLGRRSAREQLAAWSCAIATRTPGGAAYDSPILAGIEATDADAAAAQLLRRTPPLENREPSNRSQLAARLAH